MKKDLVCNDAAKKEAWRAYQIAKQDPTAAGKEERGEQLEDHGTTRKALLGGRRRIMGGQGGDDPKRTLKKPDIGVVAASLGQDR